MSGSRRSFPPPEDAAARYDAVLRRGRNLRRRRQLATGAGAGGAMLAMGLAVVLLVGNSEGAQPDVVADEPTTTVPKEMTVSSSYDQASKVLTVEVVNPEMIDTGMGRQCVTVLVRPADTSETVGGATDCGNTEGVDVPFRLEPNIGCAAWQERSPTTSTVTRPRDDVFRFDLGALPTGDYVAEIAAVSGSGDGCGDTEPGVDEARADSEVLTVP